MSEEPTLVPVLQLGDRAALEAAREHLGREGFVTRVGPFEELPDAQRQDWMVPANGGFLFYLEKDRYEAAMPLLGRFFGCTE